MAITSVDTLTSAIAGSQRLPFYRPSISTQGAGGWTSLWLSSGGYPEAGAAPTTAATCTDDMQGGQDFVNPGSGTNYLLGVDISGSISHQFYLFDRLSHMGGLSGVTTGAQTVNLAIPGSRDATATTPGMMWFAEIYTAIGTTARSYTITYTDNADASKTVTLSLGGASPLNQASRLYQVIPNAGEVIKTIVSANTATSTGTAGNFGFTCARLLTTKNMGQIYTGMSYDYAQVGLPAVPNDACLWGAIINSSTTSGIIAGQMTLGAA
jgi:hypothetical protein